MRLLQPIGLHQSVACGLGRELQGYRDVVIYAVYTGGHRIAVDGCQYDHNQLDRNHQYSHAARAEKAKKVFPRPTAGPLRPIVHGQTIKYNLKKRLGRGFTFEELKVNFASSPHAVLAPSLQGNAQMVCSPGALPSQWL